MKYPKYPKLLDVLLSLSCLACMLPALEGAQVGMHISGAITANFTSRNVVSSASETETDEATQATPLSTLEVDALVGGTMKFSDLNTYCLDPAPKRIVEAHMKQKRGSATHFFSLESSEPLTTLKTWAFTSGQGIGGGFGGHWNLEIGASCLPWEQNGSETSSSGCSVFSHKIKAISDLFDKLNENLHKTWTQHHNSIVQIAAKWRCSLLQDLISTEEKQEWCNKYIKEADTLELIKVDGFDGTLQKKMKSYISQTLSLWSSGEFIHYRSTSYSDISDEFLRAFATFNANSHSKVRDIVIEQYQANEKTDRYKDAESALNSMDSNKKIKKISEEKYQKVVHAVKYLSTLLFQGQLVWQAHADDNDFVTTLMEHYQKHIQETLLDETLWKTEDGQDIKQTDDRLQIMVQAALKLEKKLETKLYNADNMAAFAIKALISWMFQKHQDRTIPIFDILNKYVQKKNYHLLKSVKCIPSLYSVVGYGGTLLNEAIGLHRRQASGRAVAVDGWFDEPLYAKQAPASCVRWAISQMNAWNRLDGRLKQDPYEGEKTRKKAQFKIGTKALETLGKNIGGGDKPLSSKVISIPSKCVPDLAWEMFEGHSDVFVNCRMFTWCVRKLVSEICPLSTQDVAKADKQHHIEQGKLGHIDERTLKTKDFDETLDEEESHSDVDFAKNNNPNSVVPDSVAEVQKDHEINREDVR